KSVHIATSSALAVRRDHEARSGDRWSIRHIRGLAYLATLRSCPSRIRLRRYDLRSVTAELSPACDTVPLRMSRTGRWNRAIRVAGEQCSQIAVTSER